MKRPVYSVHLNMITVLVCQPYVLETSSLQWESYHCSVTHSCCQNECWYCFINSISVLHNPRHSLGQAKSTNI